ncbi:MAG: hypothetical protein KI793_21325 [Rivularia sp. (in: Bacteria)]|nr:hypothetical protein [Rivularia sp. MS3]
MLLDSIINTNLEVIMSRQVDLNEVRNRFIRNRQSDIDLPSSQNRAVYADREGNIVTQPQASEQRQLSQVPQKVFAVI